MATSNKQERPESCYSCDYTTDKLKPYPADRGCGKEDAWLCDVCASTLAGNAYFWPTHYESAEVMKQISYCTNLILDAIKVRGAA